MSSADNICKQFDPNQVRHVVGPDLDPNCMTLMLFLKEFFEKVGFEKKSADFETVTQNAKF